MAEFEKPPAVHQDSKDNKDRTKVELHDLSEECFIEVKYMGTDADRHDMVMLGRKQVLRVCTKTARRSNLKRRWLRLLSMS